jgi:hypothetical protein
MADDPLKVVMKHKVAVEFSKKESDRLMKNPPYVPAHLQITVKHAYIKWTCL